MYIKRAPLGQGNLTFKKKRQRYPLVLIILYLAILAGALYAFTQAQTLQPKIAALIGPPPTPTPSPDELVHMAEEAYHAGDLVKAADLYRQAAQIDPQNVQTLTNLSRVLTIQSETQPPDQQEASLNEALAVAEQIIRIAPEDPRGYAAKARALDWGGQYDNAAVAALRAIELDGNYAPAHAYLAEVYTDLGQLRLAREQAELAIQLDPYDVDARRNYAYVLEYYGDYEGAVQQYIQALQLEPNMLDLMYGLAHNYRGAGQYEQAIAIFRKIMERTPDDPLIYVDLGKTYFEVRDDDAAQGVLEQAVRMVCPDCPLYSNEDILSTAEPPFLDRPDRKLPEKIYMSAWVRLGQVYYTRRNYESALEILEEAIAYGEAYPQQEKVPIEAYYVTAGAYYYLDRCELAVPRAKRALDVYVADKATDPGALKSILSVFVLCRDYADTPYVLTAPGFTNGFPDGYQEPDVTIERPGSQKSLPPSGSSGP